MLAINIYKAIEHLLYEEYDSEFISEEGYRQHPDGLNFDEWLEKKKLLIKEED